MTRSMFFAAAFALSMMPLPGQAQEPTASSLYLENCALCHGEGASGPTNPDYQGSILVGNSFVRGLRDGQLIEFLKKGRPEDAPDSTMHVLMPAFDYLSESEMKLVVKFLRRVAP